MVAVAFLVLDTFVETRFGSFCIALSRVAKTLLLLQLVLLSTFVQGGPELLTI
jgi:hypothetical protein